MMLQNIEYLIDGNGDISIGRVGPIRCAATAADEHEQLAALVRRPDESLAHLLERLDAAIGKALEDGVIFRHKGASAFPAYRSQRVFGVMEPAGFRHIGAS